MLRKLLFLVLFFLLLLPAMAYGRVGVGVGSGKIEITEKLKPGGIYEFPDLPVLNTGDEDTKYGISLEYHEGQKQFKPLPEWFVFEPDTFDLKPGGINNVKVSVFVPVKAIPGDYFAYLEAHPIKEAQAGVTSVGIAAASKLYFTVAPSNFFQGLYYRVVFFCKHYAPWTWIVPLILLVIVFFVFLKKRFKFELNVSKK